MEAKPMFTGSLKSLPVILYDISEELGEFCWRRLDSMDVTLNETMPTLTIDDTVYVAMKKPDDLFPEREDDVKS